MKNFEKILIVMLCLGFVLIGSLIFYVVKLNDRVVDSNKVLKEEIVNNSKSIDYISSGMSLDEIRLRKVLQTEKIIKYYNDSLGKEFVHSLAINIIDATSKYPSLDHVLFCAMIAVESKFKPNAVSVMDARGLGQLLPTTAEDISFRFTWDYKDSIEFHPEKNVLMSSYYISKLIDRNKGDVELALVEYNGGFKMKKRYNFLRRKGLDSLQKIEVLNLSTEAKEYPGKVFKQEKILREKFKFILERNDEERR